MPPRRTFDAELAALEELRNASPEAAKPELAKALNLRNNFLVAKAAAVILHHRLTDLTPNLVAAFPLFADKELPVQLDAVRAIVQVGSDPAALLLRLRAELASDEPELLGSCYSGVLALDGPGAIPWAAKFLSAEDDAAGEAAMAIAQTHTPEAFQDRGVPGRLQRPSGCAGIRECR